MPKDERIIVAPPRMNLYIQRNVAVNKMYRTFVADADCYPYSIDESILDMTKSWQLFGDSPLAVARHIQKKDSW